MSNNWLLDERDEYTGELTVETHEIPDAFVNPLLSVQPSFFLNDFPTDFDFTMAETSDTFALHPPTLESHEPDSSQQLAGPAPAWSSVFGSEAPANANLGLDFLFNLPDQSATPITMPTVSASTANNQCGNIFVKLQPDEHGTLVRVRYKKCPACCADINLGPGQGMEAFKQHLGRAKCRKTARQLKLGVNIEGPSSRSLTPTIISGISTPASTGSLNFSLELLSSTSSTPSYTPGSEEAPSEPFINWGCPGIRVQLDKDMFENYPWGFHKANQLSYYVDKMEAGGYAFWARSIKCIAALAATRAACEDCRRIEGSSELQAMKDRCTSNSSINTNHRYLSISQIRAQVQERNNTIEQLRFERLRNTRKISTLTNRATQHELLMTTISMNDVAGLSRLIRAAVESNAGPREIVRRIQMAADGLYNVKSFSQRDRDLSSLVQRAGGPRLLFAVSKGLGIPGISTTNSSKNKARIQCSTYAPTRPEVLGNIASMFQDACLPPQRLETTTEAPMLQPFCICIDELALESRGRYDSVTDSLIGISRETAGKLDLSNLSINPIEKLERVGAAIESGECRLAKEVTMLAFASFSEVNYQAQVVLASGTDKTELEPDQTQLLQLAIDCWNESPHGRVKNGPIICLATDGDARRRRSMHKICLNRTLSRASPLFDLIGDLPLMNLRCGIDDMTHDGDYKHEQKRFASALRGSSGVLIGNTHLSVGTIQQNILLLGVTLELVELLFNASDPQNVPKANRLLSLIQDASQLESVTSSEDQRAFVLLGKLVGGFAQAFTDIELSLFEQLVLLSQTGHLMFALFRQSKNSFIPGQLYYDVQATIKNAFWCVAKVQIMGLNRTFHLLQCGTDRLENLFSTLRTMTNDRNMDLLQACERAAGSQEVNKIFERQADLNRNTYRLSLGGKDGIDHTNPRSWRGDVVVGNVRLSSAWIQGRDQAAQALSRAGITSIFDPNTLHLEHKDIDLMRPLGNYIGLREDAETTSSAVPTTSESRGAETAPHGALELFLNSNEPADQVELSLDSEASIELEFMLEQPSEQLSSQTIGEVPPKKGWIQFENKWIHMETAVKHYVGPTGGARSTDRLRRVRCYTRDPNQPSAQDVLDVESDFVLGQLALTFVRASGFFAAAIIRVTTITLSGGENRRGIAYDQLSDPGVVVRGQVLVLKQDYESLNWVWQREQAWETLGSAPNKQTASHTSDFTIAEPAVSKQTAILEVPAYLITPICPDGSNTQEIWSFDDESLKELALDSWVLLSANRSLFPVRMATRTFPYRALNGELCFVQTLDSNLAVQPVGESPGSDGPTTCFLCAQPVSLSKMRAHVAVHILASQFGIPDPVLKVPIGALPCGFCGRSGTCTIGWAKPKRTFVVSAKCPFSLQFSLGPAGKVNEKKPTSNRPIKCEACGGATADLLHNNDHVYWSYNMPEHLRVMHPGIQDGGSVSFRRLFEVTQEERALLGVSSGTLVAPQKYIIRTSAAKGKARASEGQAELGVAGPSSKRKRPLDSHAIGGSKHARR